MRALLAWGTVYYKLIHLKLCPTKHERAPSIADRRRYLPKTDLQKKVYTLTFLQNRKIKNFENENILPKSNVVKILVVK